MVRTGLAAVGITSALLLAGCATKHQATLDFQQPECREGATIIIDDTTFHARSPAPLEWQTQVEDGIGISGTFSVRGANGVFADENGAELKFATDAPAVCTLWPEED